MTSLDIFPEAQVSPYRPYNGLLAVTVFFYEKMAMRLVGCLAMLYHCRNSAMTVQVFPWALYFFLAPNNSDRCLD
jgi:hypothetical protein